MDSNDIYEDSNQWNLVSMHGWLFMDAHLVVNYPPKPNKTNTRATYICLMNPGIYVISCFFIKHSWMSAISLVYPVLTDSVQFLHVIDCKAI